MTFRFGTEQTFNDIQGRECYLIQEKKQHKNWSINMQAYSITVIFVYDHYGDFIYLFVCVLQNVC